MESFFPEARNSELQTYNVREKEQFSKYFSGIFETLEHSFLSDLFKKSICSGVFSSSVGCIIYSINCIKKKLYDKDVHGTKMFIYIHVALNNMII